MSPLETILGFLQDPDFLHPPGKKRRTSVLDRALRALSLEEARQVAHLLLHQREPEDDDAAAFLGRVNAAVPGTLGPFQAELLERQVFRPGWLYLGAEASTCQQVLRLVTDPAFSAHRYFLLDCLVWIGDEQVQAQFQAWRHVPPSWHVTERYGSLEDYPLAAGWELTPEGGRHNLYAPRAFELALEARGANQHAKGPLAMGTVHEEHCHWCHRPLLTLLELNLRDPRCAEVVAPGERLRMAYCTCCSYYVPIFTDVDLAGASHWSEENGALPDLLRQVGYEGESYAWPHQRLVLGGARRTPFETLQRELFGEGGILTSQGFLSNQD